MSACVVVYFFVGSCLSVVLLLLAMTVGVVGGRGLPVERCMCTVLCSTVEVGAYSCSYVGGVFIFGSLIHLSVHACKPKGSHFKIPMKSTESITLENLYPHN